MKVQTNEASSKKKITKEFQNEQDIYISPETLYYFPWRLNIYQATQLGNNSWK